MPRKFLNANAVLCMSNQELLAHSNMAKFSLHHSKAPITMILFSIFTGKFIDKIDKHCQKPRKKKIIRTLFTRRS